MPDSARRQWWLTVVALALALYSAGASAVAGVYSTAVGLIGCLDSCSATSSDWAEDRSAWQWNAAAVFGCMLMLFGVFLLVAVALAGSLPRLGVLLSAVAVAGQVACLVVFRELAASSDRKDHLTATIMWIGVTVIAAGVSAVVIRRRGCARGATS